MGRVLVTDQQNPSAQVLAEAAKVLLDGGVLVMPTDSVYGIGCAAYADNPAHERIFSIKQRERTQTLPWLIASADELLRYGTGVSPEAVELAQRYWPGALTVVVEASDAVPQEYKAADGTVALRCPDSALVRGLAHAVGTPLATTSANTHGEAAAVSGSGIEQRIIEAADLTLDAGPAPVGVASTIVGCFSGGLQIFREGAISREELLA